MCTAQHGHRQPRHAGSGSAAEGTGIGRSKEVASPRPSTMTAARELRCHATRMRKRAGGSAPSMLPGRAHGGQSRPFHPHRPDPHQRCSWPTHRPKQEGSTGAMLGCAASSAPSRAADAANRSTDATWRAARCATERSAGIVPRTASGAATSSAPPTAALHTPVRGKLQRKTEHGGCEKHSWSHMTKEMPMPKKTGPKGSVQRSGGQARAGTHHNPPSSAQAHRGM